MAIAPVVNRYVAYGGARTLLESHTPEVLICGPSGSGKSAAAVRKIDALCERNPFIRCLMLRATRKSLTESVLVEYERWQPPGSALLAGADRAHRSRYNYPNGSEVVLGGLDEPQRIMSSQYDVAFVNETSEISEAAWETILTRLRNNRLLDKRTGRPWHQAIGDCNPSYPTHWLKARCDRGQMLYIESKHQDNPTCTPEYLERLSQLSGVRRKRLYLGEWCAAEGAVYDAWDRDVHLIDPFPIPDEWPRLRAVDLGFRDPTVVLWLATDPDGRAYVYRQWYRTAMLVEDHARIIAELTGDEPVQATVCDHDAEDRGTLERHGISTVAADKRLLAGIQVVSSRLRRAADGKPRLFVFRDSLVQRDPALAAAKKPTCIEEEFEAYE
jgi:phage terminase large subunit